MLGISAARSVSMARVHILMLFSFIFSFIYCFDMFKTALMQACRRGHWEVVQALLIYRTNVSSHF